MSRRFLRLKLIEEELDEFEAALGDQNLVEMADALGDLLYVAFGAAVEFGLDMEKIVDEIHRSNLTKLGADGLPVYEPNTGKVLKGPGYMPPNIEKAMQPVE